MNRNVGIISSSLLTMAVAVFAISMLAGAPNASYGSSLVLSWTYAVVAASVTAEAVADRRAAAYSALVFASLYASFASIVYFVQLTTVLHQTASPEILKVLAYRELGSLMFNVDLLAYAFMSLSTFFLGLTICARTAGDKALKILLLLHGAFAPACILMPLSNVFGAMDAARSANIGVSALIFWCLYFAPIGILLIRHFSPQAVGDPSAPIVAAAATQQS